MKLIKSLLVGTALLAATSFAWAQEQYVPLLSYRVGPYGSNGTSFFGGMIDYMNLVNMSGGINGVKLTWEECETEYNPSRGVECYERLKGKNGGAALVEPLSTGIAYGILDRVGKDKIPMTTLGYGRSDAANGKVFPYVFPLITTYWNQAAAMVVYLGERAGGMDKLKGKKIVHLYHDSAYGKEPLPVLEAEAAKWGFELVKIPITPPGNEQQSQWLQIRQQNPDYVIMWTFGVMSAVGLKTAQRNGFPREKILGVWWAGSEEDTEPAGEAARGFSTISFTTPGEFPLLEEIRTKLYKTGKGNLKEIDRVGNVMYTRGIAAAVMMIEAMRTAQAKYGKGKVLTGEQMRWGLENLNIDRARQKALGVEDMFPPVKTSCDDHEGSGAVKVVQWDGKKWVALSKTWITGDKALVRKLLEESSAAYAKEKGITPACMK
ncbi:MAG: ABC transporter substrate-binding protein [Burkholderiaceae bacterium]|nr:ABC transporter substrate-binding protein [Burkholderiaceae bacterium]